MTYNSLSEIFAKKRDVLQRLQRTVQGLTPGQEAFHPSKGGWSITEIMEHLTIVEAQLLQLVTTLTKKTKEAGKTKSENSPFQVSVGEFLERSKTETYVTRDKFSPKGNVSVSDSLKTLEHLQSECESLRPELQEIDIAFATFPHWVFGTLTLGQWLAFIGLHEERHLKQIIAITEESEFINL